MNNICQNIKQEVINILPQESIIKNGKKQRLDKLLNPLLDKTDEICNEIKETFDTNILFKDNLNNDLKNSFYTVANKCKRTNCDNTLYKLIRNQRNLLNNIQRVDFIGGPTVVQHLYNKEYKIDIYLFGERHSDQTDCNKIGKTSNNREILIENYLENLIQNTHVFLDIYLEIPTFGRETYKRTDFMRPQRMQELFLKFFDCVQTSTRQKEKCELARFHYVDIREENYYFNDFLSFFYNTKFQFSKIIENQEKQTEFLNKLEEFKNNEYWINQINKWSLMYKIQRSYLSKKIIQYFTKKIILSSEYFKSFEFNNKIDLIKNAFNDYNYNENQMAIFKKEIEEIRKRLQDFEKLPKLIAEQKIKYKKSKEELEKKEQSILYLKIREQQIKEWFINFFINEQLLLKMNALFMDMYTCSRIFKTFRNISTKQPEKPHNIIYYAGYEHTKNILEFLLNIGFERIESSGNFSIINNCINMEKIRQPFFYRI